MARRHYRLPPLSALASFETAARNRSFKLAAGELNVTPGAVSHQIKALERDLGVALFERKHRGVELTESGRMLFRVLERSFMDIGAVLAILRKSPQDKSISIASSSAVSSLWLTPRITQFWKTHEDIPVNQIVSDLALRPGELTDLRIQYGRSSDPIVDQHELFRDQLVPVCSPEIAERLAGVSLEELAQQTLIHLEAENSNWTTWYDWFADLGYTGRIARGRKVNNYLIALQAAQDGAGIVLGWQRLARPLIEKGLLAPLPGHALPSPKSFHILSAPDALISANTRVFKQWLLQNI